MGSPVDASLHRAARTHLISLIKKNPGLHSSGFFLQWRFAVLSSPDKLNVFDKPRQSRTGFGLCRGEKRCIVINVFDKPRAEPNRVRTMQSRKKVHEYEPFRNNKEMCLALSRHISLFLRVVSGMNYCRSAMFALMISPDSLSMSNAITFTFSVFLIDEGEMKLSLQV